MSIFSFVREHVSVPEAAEAYALGNGRNRRRVVCPFHDDHDPSLALYDDHFYCFACGAHGDVIDLVGGLFHLSPYQSAQKLAADFKLNPQGFKDSVPKGKSILDARRREKEEDERCHNALVDYLWQLRGWEEEFRPEHPDDDWDVHFVEALAQLPVVEELLDLWQTATPEERKRIRESDAVKEILE